MRNLSAANLFLTLSAADLHWDDLICRCDFDWAEDDEDAVVNGNLPMAATSKSLNCSLPKANWYNEAFPTHSYVLTPN